MKRLLSSALFVTLSFVLSLASAAVVVAEPSLPSDIESWTKLKDTTCNNNGQIVVQLTYYKDDEWLVVLIKNGQKVVQSRVNESAPGSAFYAKNSSEGNWLMYRGDERAEMTKLVENEIGLTEQQFFSCARKK